ISVPAAAAMESSNSLRGGLRLLRDLFCGRCESTTLYDLLPGCSEHLLPTHRSFPVLSNAIEITPGSFESISLLIDLGGCANAHAAKHREWRAPALEGVLQQESRNNAGE